MPGGMPGAGGAAGPGGGPGGPGGGMQMQGGAPGGMPGGQQGGGDEAAAGGGRGGRGGGGRGAGGEGGQGGGGGFAAMRNMSDEDRARFRELMTKAMAGKDPSKLSAEERQKMFAQVQEQMKAEAAKKGDTKKGEAKQGETKQGEPKKGGGDAPVAREGRRGGGGPAGSGGMGGNPLDLMRLSAASSQQFTEEDRANAKLPLPPEEDSQLQVLLRPGLLADVEIIVEKIPNALHVPAQAVFEKDGKPWSTCRTGKQFEARPIKLVKRSESMMVMAERREARRDWSRWPTRTPSKPTARRDKGDKKGGGGAMGGMPAGGKQ